MLVAFVAAALACTPTFAAKKSKAAADDDIFGMLEMSDQLDRLDSRDFQEAIDRVNDCTRARDFSCSEKELAKAAKLANGAQDKKTLLAARQNVVSEKALIAEEKRRREEEKWRLAKEEERRREAAEQRAYEESIREMEAEEKRAARAREEARRQKEMNFWMSAIEQQGKSEASRRARVARAEAREREEVKQFREEQAARQQRQRQEELERQRREAQARAERERREAAQRRRQTGNSYGTQASANNTYNSSAGSVSAAKKSGSASRTPDNLKKQQAAANAAAVNKRYNDCIRQGRTDCGSILDSALGKKSGSSGYSASNGASGGKTSGGGGSSSGGPGGAQASAKPEWVSKTIMDNAKSHPKDKYIYAGSVGGVKAYWGYKYELKDQMRIEYKFENTNAYPVELLYEQRIVCASGKLDDLGGNSGRRDLKPNAETSGVWKGLSGGTNCDEELDGEGRAIPPRQGGFLLEVKAKK